MKRTIPAVGLVCALVVDASVDWLKERIKLQIEQEQQNGQEVFDGPNEQDLDNMLDNLLIFDQ